MASTKNILEVQDPETNSLITFELNEEDFIELLMVSLFLWILYLVLIFYGNFRYAFCSNVT